MTKELLQQALNEAKADAIEVFTYKDGISAASKDAIEYMHSWLTVYFDKQALAQQEPCGCREGECETKKDKTCRMTIEIAERDGIPEWTPAIGIECAISNLRDDAARLRDGGYTPLQIADDLDVIANDLAKCKPDAQQEQPASVDAYVGAREDAAIWKKRALEAEELNRKFIADVNGPTYLGEPVKQEHPAQEPVAIAECKVVHGHFCQFLNRTRHGMDTLKDGDKIYTHPVPTQPAQEVVAWEGAEGWEPLAWHLCAEENGEEACNELIWEGGATPEPWGDRWLKYEQEAKRMIAAVKKFASPTQPALTNPDIVNFIREAGFKTWDSRFFALCKSVAAHCRGGNHG